MRLAHRLLIAFVPQIEIHEGGGVMRKVSLTKVINIGIERMERQIRRDRMAALKTTLKAVK